MASLPTHAEIERWFAEANVSLSAGTSESPGARIARIFNQIATGERTPEGVRASIDNLAKNNPSETYYEPTPVAGPPRIGGIPERGSQTPPPPGSTSGERPTGGFAPPTEEPYTTWPIGNVNPDPMGTTLSPEVVEAVEEEDEFDEEAFAILSRLLADYGLESLEPWLRDAIINGWSVDRIRAELPNQQAYKDRFPGLEIRKANNLPLISPNEYIRLELEFESLLSRANMPESFWDSHEDFAELIGNNVTIADLAQRINRGYQAVVEAPKEIRDVFAEYFGVNGDSALAAFFLDPEREEAKLIEAAEMAAVGGTARRFGLEIGMNKSRRIRGLGLSAQQVAGGFAGVNGQRPLFRETLTERTDLTAEGIGVDSAFGLDPNARERLKQRLESRISRFGGSSGGAVVTQGGVTGLGSANRL